MDLRCGGGVGVSKKSACRIEFPGCVGGLKYAAGAWVCGGSVVHDACIGSGSGEGDGVDRRCGFG